MNDSVMPVAKEKNSKPVMSGQSMWTAKKRSDDVAPFIKDVVDQNVERHYARTKGLEHSVVAKDLNDTMKRLCVQFFDSGHMTGMIDATESIKAKKWLQRIIKRIFPGKPSKK